ncbi:2-oxoglutarate dehydrogenase E1 component [Enterovirga sp.]|uniref:2-oxoglutarate dehydrogenase E1 component n=1 Tax=Enterovirga sp. TaxID=2026350 RepID=UPI00261EBDDE|nr:2-oxoglutarate dehydrogenase E1 component [Enterovirga sp.]MDB5591330.1 sucA [Enterovirga sp.]
MSGLAGTSVAYLEDLFRRYQDDPASVEPSWRSAFDLAAALSDGDRAPNGADRAAVLREEAVRQRGHLTARLDPLGRPPRGAELPLDLPNSRPGLSGAELSALYGSSLTVETAHIDDPAMRAWVQEAFEAERLPLPADTLLRAHGKVMQAEEFESFLGRKYPTKKRFGAEGAEGLFALLDRLFTAAAAAGVEEAVVGPMHRGRTSLMGVIFGTELPELFARFKGAHPFPADPVCPADVPYHLGAESERSEGGRSLRVTLCPNPSHLEAVNPVVAGRVRARQELRPVGEAGRVLGLLLHSDAAVVGQGIVGETLQLGTTPGFATEGTIHVVVNNQIGFTTEPWEGRASRHCTGPFKAVDALILHVNGDDVEACLRAAELAVGFRQRFRRDAVIDFVCYRRNGHNELDEPRFTQPRIYAAIDAHPSVRQGFEQRLLAEGVLTAEQAASLAEGYRQELAQAFDAAATWRTNRSAFPGGRWEPFRPAGGTVPEPESGIEEDRLRRLLRALATPPAERAIHPKVRRLVEQRADAEARGLPWSLAEGLAFASLVTEGVPVRLTGQDAVRGTFSSRHFGLVDTETGARACTIAELEPGQAPFAIHNSPLSEYGVLGFEYGYSLERPDGLTLWEAQFGDFANGAQIMIDQFVTSGEEKWLQPSGLVMLVPHGLEGQGPEHSSARPERYLQLAARDNIQLANPSTPANYFHLLRRQVLRRIRKPLVVLAPKTLLRLPAAVSTLAEFGPGTRFQPVLASGPAGARRLLICTGKIAYELERARAAQGLDDIQIIRLEMIYPLPAAALSQLLAASPEAELVLVQEEPENMGVWSWLRPRLEELAEAAGCRTPKLRYVGRPESPSPAGSFHGHHERDQDALVARALA